MKANSNQPHTDGSNTINDPHLSTSDGTHLTMPGAGVKHGGAVHYDQPTRSDSNNETGPS